MIKKAFLISTLILLTLSWAHAQSEAVLIEANRFGSLGDDIGYSVAVDDSGNTYICGSFWGMVDFDPDTGIADTAFLVALGSMDIFFAKYNASGKIQWANSINGVSPGVARHIVVDTSGSTYITGDFSGTFDFDPGPGTVNLTSPLGNDIFFAKYDATGAYVWAKSLVGTNNNEGYSIAVDDSGNTYITAYLQDTVDVDPGAGTVNIISTDANILFAKYDANGAYLWANSIGSTSLGDHSFDIVTDDGGNAFITGMFWDSIDFDTGPDTAILTPVGSADIFFAKYDASGNYIWAKSIGGPGGDWGQGIAVDDTGNIYLTGLFQLGADFDPGPGVENLPYAGNADIFFSKYNADGDFLWAKSIGSSGDDIGSKIVVDGTGNTYITGYIQGAADFDPGPGTAIPTVAGFRDIFFAKYDANGSYLWAKTIGGSNDDYGNDIAVNSTGDVYVTGYFQGTADFDPNEGIYNLTSAGGKEIFLLKMSQKGVRGHVFHDFSEDCVLDTNETGLAGRGLTITPGNIIVLTNAAGYWMVDSLPAGTYTIIPDTSGKWSLTCPVSQTFIVTNPSGITYAPSFGFISTEPCTAPNISVYAPFLRRCFPNQNVYIQACNEYTATGTLDSAYVEVQLDSLLIVQSATLPYTFLGANKYRFEIGTLFPGACAGFSITYSLSCNAVLNQTLCMQADLYPADPCVFDTIPNPFPPSVTPCSLPWDNSSLQVEGYCENDSIFFVIANTGDLGTGDMDCYSPVRVYIDGQMVILDSVQLLGGDSIAFAYSGDGRTWRLEADQHPLHPGNSNPNATIELCGDTSNWTPNLFNLHVMDDADPITDIYCGSVRGSYDPNDKTGYPHGATDSNFIAPNGQLQYVIRFQNTGTDTAFTVVIRDTLEADLNIFSVVAGVSNHTYTFKMHGPRVLEWTFENILLPDSTTNEPESHGFVTFTVNQIPNLTNGTLIQNSADIYFDFNLPIITNATEHNINDKVQQVSWAVDSILSFSTCAAAYTLNGFTYNTSGTYLQHIAGVGGADTVVTLNVTINSSTSAALNATACDSYTVPSGNETYMVNGTYMDTIPNVAGCDSIITINLTVTNGTNSVINPTVCDSYTVPSGDESYMVTGTYMDTIPNVAGCDSVVTINLTVTPTYSINTSGEMICNGDSVEIFGIYQNTAGTYTDSALTTMGCDSVTTTTLTVNQVPAVSFTGLDSSYCSVDGGVTMTGIPTGGTFSGTGGVAGDEFYPATGIDSYIVTYSYTDSLGCSNDSSQSVSVKLCTTTTAIPNSEGMANFKIYPNPANDEITFEFEKAEGRRITIYNASGQLILLLDSKEKINTVDLEGYSAGLYYYQVKSNDGIILGSGEFVKQ